MFAVASGARFDQFARPAGLARAREPPMLSFASLSFIASRSLGFFAMPSNDLLAAGLIGLLLLRSKRTARAGRRLSAAAIVLLLVFGLLPAGKLMMAPLEARFPPWDAARGAPGGIVVLGGVVEPEVADRPDSGLNEAAERLTSIAGLARKYPDAKILFSGGDNLLIPGDGSEARVAGALLTSFGIPASRLILEDRSRTTAENAAFSLPLAQPKPGERWLLVTSAWHMPRAVGAFRAAGFPVEAYPVDYRTPGPPGLWLPFGSVGAGLRRTDIAAREWFGLLTYWLTDRSSALFPAP
jgi:uncharacterized SAM-binding protein YcdF (DUF218 family)